MTSNRVLCVAALVLGTAATQAQTGWRAVAVPYYTPPAFVQGLNAHWAAPRANEFVARTSALSQALGSHCAAAPAGHSAEAREAWRAALLAWARLSAVAIGPLVERRTARHIDFQPVRPELLARAIEAQPAGADAMARIGSPAKGFPALEALLWPQAAAPASPACTYALEVAADIGREAQAMATAFDTAARTEPDDDTSVPAMSDAVNQWLGGLDALRLQGFERPLLEQKTHRAARATFPRAASGAGAAERSARWQALEALAVLDGPEAPAAGAGLVPLEPYLRGKGLNPLADTLVAAVRRADRAVDAASGNAPARVQAAATALGRLKALVENEVAPALDIRLGFSDADGD